MCKNEALEQYLNKIQIISGAARDFGGPGPRNMATLGKEFGAPGQRIWRPWAKKLVPLDKGIWFPWEKEFGAPTQWNLAPLDKGI